MLSAQRAFCWHTVDVLQARWRQRHNYSAALTSIWIPMNRGHRQQAAVMNIHKHQLQPALCMLQQRQSHEYSRNLQCVLLCVEYLWTSTAASTVHAPAKTRVMNIHCSCNAFYHALMWNELYYYSYCMQFMGVATIERWERAHLPSAV